MGSGADMGRWYPEPSGQCTAAGLARHDGAILVIRPSSLGDVVHALALVSDVHRHRPTLAIDWVAEEAFVPLVKLEPRIRRVFPLALRRWRHHLQRRVTWTEMSAFRTAIAGERYTAVLDLQEQLKGALVARLAVGPRHGPVWSSIKEPLATLLHDVHHRIAPGQHLIARCRALAAAALGYPLEGPPQFGLQAPVTSPLDLAGPYVVCVHATSRTSKLWPESDWRRLIANFGEAGYRIVLPWGAEAERERSARLAAAHGATLVPSGLSLPEVAAVLGRADLVVGVDTGLVHLAAALGRPTLALFTSTDPRGAGVGTASATGRDLGGNGQVPSLDDVRAAAFALLGGEPVKI